MFVHDLVGNETNPVYQVLSIDNLDRQYSFLRSAVIASLGVNRPLLSIEVIKSLNYHAITCLHAYAGEYRPCRVTVGDYVPPQHYQVPALMQMFVDEVNRFWDSTDRVQLTSYVLWKLNRIHPFINGNGRAARAACYFVLCLKSDGWLAGEPILPELIRRNRDEYLVALKAVDAAVAAGTMDLSALHGFLTGLLEEQMKRAAASTPAAVGPAQPPAPDG